MSTRRKRKFDMVPGKDRLTIHLEAWLGCKTKQDANLLRDRLGPDFEEKLQDFFLLHLEFGRWMVDHVEADLTTVVTYKRKYKKPDLNLRQTIKVLPEVRT